MKPGNRLTRMGDESALAEADLNATSARPDSEAGSRRFRLLDALCGTNPCKPWGAAVVLTAGLIVTALASLYIKLDVVSDAQREFDFTCNETRLEIETRLKAGAQILRSGAAFFDASETVSRGEWRTFTRRLQIDQYLPGIQGLGFTVLIPGAQLGAHVQAVRGEGFPAYHVRPVGERELYSAIIYLEPFDDRNQRAFGFDMFSEPVRRVAMERARDEDTVALSGKVTLVQETDQDVQAGVLMYVPVYRHGVPVESIAQRRAALQGWVYSPYRMTDLMHGTLWHWDRMQTNRQIALQVYDGDAPTADTLLYDSEGVTGTVPAASAQVDRLIPVDFAGRRWTLRFTQPGGLVALADYDSVWFVLFGGTISSLLLTGLMLWRQQRVRLYRESAQAGEALRESEARYRAVVEHSADGILIAALETKRFTYANLAMCRMLGYTEHELKTLGTPNIVPIDDLPRAVSAFEAQARGEKTMAFGIPLIRKDGTIVHVDVNSTTITIDGTLSMLGIFRDITEHTRMEGALREQQKLASVGTLARGMAHEINNPLMGIMNYAELITDQAVGNASLVDYAAEILTGGRRVARMTQSLLGFTQQKADVAFETTTLEALVAAVLPPAGETAQEKGIVLSIDMPPDLPPVTCRRRQLEQTLKALLSNAMEAWDTETPDPASPEAREGKKIVVSARVVVTRGQSSVARADTDHRSPITDHASPCDMLRLTVADNGPGISAAIRDRVFDPFFTTKDRAQHAGLGLWISRSCAQEHGGALTFESPSTVLRGGEGDRGTRFHMDIPVVRGSGPILESA